MNIRHVDARRPALIAYRASTDIMEMTTWPESRCSREIKGALKELGRND